MSDSSQRRGRCACGGVTYVIEGPLRSVANCHCEPCRRVSGHFLAATSAPVEAVTIAGTTLQWWARTPEVEYGFCCECGSTLFWRATDKPGHLSITAGTLDQPTGLVTELALFTSEAGDYHRLDPDVVAVDQDRLPTTPSYPT